MNPLLISLVSACTALMASVAGPLVTLRVARRQINATVLSANRQKWIETLRDLLSELISLLVAITVVKSGWEGRWDRGRGPIAADKTLIPKLERVVLIQWKIRLLLNPAVPDHQALHRAIETAFEGIQSEERNVPLARENIEAITNLAHRILRQEWERVKRGV